MLKNYEIQGEEIMMSIWHIALWLAAIFGTVGAAAVLAGVGIYLLLSRRAGR